jgi:GntR family transcriptional regulator/MocR family aminotransferase
MTSLTTTKRQFGAVLPLISIDRKSQKPVYRQIYEAFRTRIFEGELRAGQLVPSTRQLAHDLRVSRFPILNAYAQLLAEGYFESRMGAGTFIASSLPGAPRSQDRKAALELATRARPVAVHTSTLPPYTKPSWADHLGPFQLGQPELNAFPLRLWSRLLARYSRNMHAQELRYGEAMGMRSLREAVAVYLGTARGVVCEADQIMIVSGSQQGLDITTRVLLDPETPVWVEEPGYWLIHHVLRTAACQPIPVPVDSEGLDVSAGIKLNARARAAFVAPSHQFPLGVTMSASRRFQLVEWAEKAGAWIIEDDYDSEYRYDSSPISSLQGLDRNSRTIYIGTFSKVLFPSLRLGYIVIPPDLVEHFAAMRQAMDLCLSPINQAVLTEFIRQGHFGRHIRKMREVYRERRRLLVTEIRKQIGSACTIMGGEAGMHLTILLNTEVRDTELAARAFEKKLWLSPLSLSYVGAAPRQGLVLGYGNTPTSQIPGAVRLLKTLVIKE